MVNTPEQQLKARQARERYRLQRRRQALMVLSWLGAALLFVAIVFATVLLTRSCSRPESDGPLVAKIHQRVEPGVGQAQQIGTNSFRIAPWLVAVDGERLYAASDSHKRERNQMNFPLDTLAAYEPGEQQPLWELELAEDSQACALIAAGGNVCTYATYLSDPPYLELRGYTGNNGASKWSKRIELAEQAQVVQVGEQIVVNYLLPDGYRITGFRGADGGRTGLGLKLELKGLATGAVDQALAQELELYTWETIIGYSYYNIAGMADAQGGEQILENALDFYVYDMAYSKAGKRGVALTGGETVDSYCVWELARDGVPLQVYQFLCPDSDILLRAAGEYTAVAFHVAEGSQAGKPQLVILRRDFATPRVEHIFDTSSIVADIVALPGEGEAVRFLVACDDGQDSDEWPIGESELYLIDPEADAPLQLLATLKQPVQYIWRLKDDCLIVCRGGRVYSYDDAQQQLTQVARLKYDLVLPQADADGSTLALLSAPAAHWKGRPGSPLNVDVFR